MSYEFKKLSEVEALTEVPDGAKVLAEVNGVIKRVPAATGEGGGAGDEIPKPLTYDYMPEGYPTKSGFKIEWDGNTEGLSSIDIGGSVIYKISDLTPTYDELVGATYKDNNGNVSVLSSHQMENQDDEYANMTVIFGGTYVIRNMPGLEPGTYTRAEGLVAYTREISKQIVTPMSPDFIPTVPYILMNSSTADSTKVFKLTVDDSGTMTATEVTT